MTVGRRLILLVAVPVVGILAFAAFNHYQLATIEGHSRFLAQAQIPSLAALGNISRGFSEMRVNVRGHLMASRPEDQAKARRMFEEDEADVGRLLQQYGDTLITSEKNRRLFTDFREL